MALRQSEVFSIWGQEGASPAEASTVWDMESSQGQNPKAAGNEFQIQKTAFQEVMPDVKYEDATDQEKARAAAKYYVKYRDAQGAGPFAGFAAYRGGPGWQKTMNDPKALEADMKANAGQNPVDYASQAVLKYKAFSTALGETPSSGEAPTQTASLTYDPLGPKGVAGSDRFLPTKQSTQDILAELYGNLSTMGKQLPDIWAQFEKKADSITNAYVDNTVRLTGYLTGVGEAEASATLATHAVNTQMAADAARTLSDAGVNTSDAQSKSADMLARMRGFSDRATELRAEIQGRTVDFIEDPVQWVKNQIDLPPLVRRHNQAITDFNIEKEQLDALNASANNLNVSNNAKRATIAGAEAQATAEVQRLKGNAAAAKANETAISANWQQLMMQQQKTMQMVQTMDTTANVLLKSESLTDQIEGRRQKAAAEALRLQVAQAAGKQVGVTINTLADVDKLTGKARDQFFKVIETGSFGPTPVDAINTVLAGDRNVMPTTTSSLLPFAYYLQQDASQEAQNKNVAHADRPVFMNDHITRIANKWQDDVHTKTGKVSNPYLAPDVKQMAADPDIQKLKIGKLLNDTLKVAPNTPINDEQLNALVYKGFTEHSTYTDIQEMVNDLVLYYKKAVDVNNKAHNFYGMRLPEQNRYSFEPPDSDIGKVDHTDYGQVMQYFTKRVGSFLKSRSGIGGFG